MEILNWRNCNRFINDVLRIVDMYYVSDPKRLEQRVLQKCNGIPKKSSLLFLKDEKYCLEQLNNFNAGVKFNWL